jgi:hypothetical protein
LERRRHRNPCEHSPGYRACRYNVSVHRAGVVPTVLPVGAGGTDDGGASVPSSFRLA